uniref:Uncharacterized protein n=1 Tax=Strigamia maritima TaxID=126957 RepID=T1JGU3_STRMM
MTDLLPMPLHFNGQPLTNFPLSTKELFEYFPDLKQNASWFCSRAPKVVGPVGLLYVTQREFAVAFPHDKCISVIGSDDATTCLIVTFRHSEIFIIFPITEALHKQPTPLDVLTFCVGEGNTLTRGGINHPIISGLGVNVKSGEVFPATFPDKGPDMALRCARHLTGSQQWLDIYDSNSSLLRIGPFNYEPLRGSDLWLSQSDSFILQHLSTSPAAEPPHFVAQIRAALRQIQLHPFPGVTVFPGNEPRIFHMDPSGHWLPYKNQYSN